MNQPIHKEVGRIWADLPKETPPAVVPEKAPFDPALSDLVLQNLFYYFRQRGYMQTVSCFAGGSEQPRVIDVSGQDSDDGDVKIVRQLPTLESIKEAGPEYLVDFMDFTMMLLQEVTTA